MDRIETVYVIFKNITFGDVIEVEAHFDEELAKSRVADLKKTLKDVRCTGHGYWYIPIPVYQPIARSTDEASP